MQVTCPNCRARYAVDPLAIGPAGRMVQCVRCSQRWFETLPEVAARPETRRIKTARSRWIGSIASVVIAAGAAAFVYREELPGRLPAAWRSVLGFDVVRSMVASPARATVASPDEPQIRLDLAASKIEWREDRYVLRGELVNAGQAPGST